MRDLCWSCKSFKDIVYTEDGTNHPFCEECLAKIPLSSDEWAFILLTSPWSPYGPPFKEGDVVECRTAGQTYDGVGTVHEMDMAFEHGGTPVYPTWRVVMTTKAREDALDEQWYTENCLTRVNQEEVANND
jgi:hypothetical protein